MNAVLENNSVIIESYKKRKSISCSLIINFNVDHLWELISSPGYLEKCHPFCKTNNVIDWDDKKHMDKIVYVNGIEYIRDFIDWNPKKGYSLIIGKKGADIEKIKKSISKITASEVTVNIKEIKKPELNANLVAENIAQQLVKRIAYRRAMKRAMQSALRLNAKGIKVMVSGRLAGNEIARTEWLREGSIPLHTLRANLDYGESEALTTYGIIGVKVWIYKGELFSKDIEKEKTERVKNATANKN